MSFGQASDLWSPLAVTIIGGLISSTLLDMIVTPAVFYRFGRRSAEKYLSEGSSKP